MNALALIDQQQYLPAETAAAATATKARAVIEARCIMAKRFPRDWDAFRERMLKDCRRPTFAAVARYEKPIGKDKTKWPKGPSIRFAEAAVRAMTNVGIETTVTYDDRQKRIVHVAVTDYESTVPYEEEVTIQKTIERRRAQEGDVIVGKRKNSYGDDVFILEATDDEIINKQRAEVSKVIRTLCLRLVPGDIIDECMALVIDTQRKEDAQDPDAAKRRLFDSFADLGVRVDQLKEYLGHDGASITQKELTELRGIYGAIRDGESTWRDVMDAKEPSTEAKAPPAAKPTLTDEAFDKKKAGWEKAVRGGKTIADLIATIETRDKLTDAQKSVINGWSAQEGGAE